MSELTMIVKGLRKTIGKKEIIKGLDFHLKRGEVFGFLGPNGSGKTTTIRMLVGLIRRNVRSISVHSAPVTTALRPRYRNRPLLPSPPGPPKR